MSSRDTLSEVTVLVRQTLALPESGPISAQQLFFYDLGFTSMDLLDLLFRVEQHFQIEIRFLETSCIRRSKTGGMARRNCLDSIETPKRE